MKVQPIRCPGTDRPSWLVLGDDFLPIEPIRAYLAFRECLGRSPNTIRSDAHHLKLYWEYLRDVRLDWASIGVEHLAHFITWLRRGDPLLATLEQPARRTDATIDQILTAVHTFYDFHARAGTVPDLQLHQFVTMPNRRYRSFLHGIVKTKPVRTRLVRVKPEHRRPKVLTQGQVQDLLAACTRTRDRFLVALVYDTGMRIGQALGLRHADIAVESGAVRIVPRDNNANGARSKSATVVTVFPSQAVLELYITYLVEDLDGLAADQLPDYVFVNLWGGDVGRPMTYAAARSLFARLERRVATAAGVSVHITPHMLRHTRATAWIRDDKLPTSTVARLLGHTSVQTTDAIYTHLADEDVRVALEAAQGRRRGQGGGQDG